MSLRPVPVCADVRPAGSHLRLAPTRDSRPTTLSSEPPIAGVVGQRPVSVHVPHRSRSSFSEHHRQVCREFFRYPPTPPLAASTERRSGSVDQAGGVSRIRPLRWRRPSSLPISQLFGAACRRASIWSRRADGYSATSRAGLRDADASRISGRRSGCWFVPEYEQ